MSASPINSRKRPKFRRPEPRPVERHDEAEARLLAARKELVRIKVSMAKDFALVVQSRHFATHDANNVRVYAERVLSLSSREATELASMGAALRRFPEAEVLVVDAHLTPGAVAALAALDRHPEVIRPEDDWLRWAEDDSAYEFRRRVARRLREEGLGRKSVRVEMYLTEEGLENLSRAQQIAKAESDAALPLEKPEGSPPGTTPSTPSSQTPSTGAVPAKTDDGLAIGPTIEKVLAFYLRAKDPLAKVPGKRRQPRTDGPDAVHNRTISAEVKRIVLTRAHCKCRIPFCDNNRYLEIVHVTDKHCEGGSREEQNLDLHCKPHHRFQEAGRIRNRGTTADPRFFNSRGEPMWRRRIVWLREMAEARERALREATAAAAAGSRTE